MIAGAAVSPQVLASAREMLATPPTAQSEAKAKGESESAAAKAKGQRRGA